MKDEALYLALIEKEKRARVKICFEGSFANAIIALCHSPKIAEMSFTWEIKTINWNLEIEEERKDFEVFLAACQKEESRNFKIAVGEAMTYSKRVTEQKKLETKNFNPSSYKSSASSRYKLPSTLPRYINHTPLVPKEEIIAKILKLQAGHL